MSLVYNGPGIGDDIAEWQRIVDSGCTMENFSRRVVAAISTSDNRFLYLGEVHTFITRASWTPCPSCGSHELEVEVLESGERGGHALCGLCGASHSILLASCRRIAVFPQADREALELVQRWAEDGNVGTVLDMLPVARMACATVEQLLNYAGEAQNLGYTFVKDLFCGRAYLMQGKNETAQYFLGSCVTTTPQ